MLGRLPIHRVVPPHVPPVGPRDLLVGALDHQHRADVRALLHRLVHRGLERRRRAPAVTTVGGDHHPGIAVDHAVGQRGRGEPAEHHRVRRAQPGTGQHRDHRLRDHRHVDRDPVTGPNAQLDQRVRGLAHLVLQLGIGDRPAVARLALPVIGHLIAVARLDVPVHAVVRHVQLATHEPPRERRIRPVQNLRPPLRPRQPLRLLGPERQPIGIGLLVRIGLHVRRRREILRRVEPAVFMGQVGECLAHVPNLFRAGGGRKG